MSEMRAEVLICGAGIAGVAAAYHLAVRHGMSDVLLVDMGAPLSLTSDKSTEAYRNFWPGPDGAMVQMLNRSIDLLEALAEESGNVFHLNRRGYLFATESERQVKLWIKAALQAAEFGAGPLRIHDGSPQSPPYQPAPAAGFRGQPTGSDLITDPALIRRFFPFLSETTVGVLHIRRAGWLSAQQLGMYLLRKGQEAGVRFLRGRVTSVAVQGNVVRGVSLAGGGRVSCRVFVNAAGPYLQRVGEMLGVQIPVFCERHLKVSIEDHLGSVPRHIPLVIWADEQVLPWSEAERAMLAEEGLTKLTEVMPAGVHARPDGEGESSVVLLLWEYDAPVFEPVFPLPKDDLYPEVVLRGMTTMLPAMKPYLNRLPRPFVDGGYYTKTRENRPLACPLPVEGAFVIGALSGYGIMSALAMGELLAAHITGAELPPYAPAFDLRRYDDPAYQRRLEVWEESWQL